MQIHWWEWAGYKIGQPIIQTGITNKRGIIKRVKDILFNTYYFEAFSTDAKSAKKAFEWAKKRKRVFLGGYASSLFVLSKFAKNESCKVDFNGAVSWGDKLFKHYKKQIKDSFNIDIRETYGSSEGFLISAQKDLEYMYIMSPHVYVEIVNDDGEEVADGELGHVIVTSLDAYTMPLIRYRIGDLAIKLPREKYPDVREFSYPLMERIIGRDTDLVKTVSGKYMVVHSFTGIFEYYDEIEQYCVVQKELKGIEILYIASVKFNEKILKKIEKQIFSYLNEDDFYILFKQVSHIKPTKSGKPQIIKSMLTN
jgi:phenylacetate-CoA ligase